MRALLLAGALGLLGTLLGTRWAIAILVKKNYGQLIRDDGPTSHHTKRGTPTMGGLGHHPRRSLLRLLRREADPASTRRPSRPCCCCSCSSGSGAVGFLDDYIKISQAAQPRPAEQGQDRRPDAVAVIFGICPCSSPTAAATRQPRRRSRSSGSSTGSCRRSSIMVWVLIMIAGASNAREPHRRSRRARHRRSR